MNIRRFELQDVRAVESIFSLYWNDPVFLKELSEELNVFLGDDKNSTNYFLVAEEADGEIVGAVGYKIAPTYLRDFATTDNPIELYVIASKYQSKGIGLQLKRAIVEVAKKAEYTEMLAFSPESHKESWAFHDTLDFERVGSVTPPEDGVGGVWRKGL